MSTSDYRDYLDLANKVHFGQVQQVTQQGEANPLDILQADFAQGTFERTPPTGIAEFFNRLGVRDGFFSNFTREVSSNFNGGTTITYPKTFGLDAYSQNLNAFDLLALEEQALQVTITADSRFFTQFADKSRYPTVEEIQDFYQRVPSEFIGANTASREDFVSIFGGTLGQKMANLLNLLTYDDSNTLSNSEKVAVNWPEYSTITRFFELTTNPIVVNAQGDIVEPLFRKQIQEIPPTDAQAADFFSDLFDDFVRKYNRVGIQPPTPQNFFESFYLFINGGINQEPYIPEGFGVFLEIEENGVTTRFTLGDNDTEPLKSSQLSGYVPGAGVQDPTQSAIRAIQDEDNGVQTLFDRAFRTVIDWSGVVLPQGVSFTDIRDDVFASYVGYLSDTGNLRGSESFFQTLSDIYGPVALLQDTTAGSSNILTYETIYRAFFPQATQGEFLTQFSIFMQEYLTENQAVFTPSLMVDEWLASLVKRTNFQEEVQPLLQSNFEATGTLLNIFDLIIALVGELHSQTAAQTERQKFLTAYQKTYSDLQIMLVGDVPKITNEYFDGYDATHPDDKKSLSFRSDMNQLVSQYNDNLNSLKSEVGDFLKQNRTTKDQTQDAVKQQLNISGAVLQQLVSILQSIWR